VLTGSPAVGAALGKRDYFLILFFGALMTVMATLPTVARTLGWAFPEWALMATLYLAYRAGLSRGCLAAFLLGCLQDGINLSPEGLEPLSLIILSFGLILAFEWITIHSFFLLITYITFASLLKNIFMIPLFLNIIGIYTGVSGVILLHWVGKAIITGFISIVVLGLLERLTHNSEK
jgi:cell shape-determining protein MreD